MDRTTVGWGSGLLGALIFSGSLPATRVAVAALTPMFVTSARAAIAAVLGSVFLVILRQKCPAQRDLLSLLVVALGVVVGFPLLTGFALQHITASRSIVFIGLLPLSTAIFGVLRGGERPRPAFWLFSLLGAGTVAVFAVSRGGSGAIVGDVLMVGAILLCGLGYAEGAALSRRLGGWQVISWALLMSFPVMASIAIASFPTKWEAVGASAWIGLAYVSVFSMFIGFMFWYRGLALGGIARVSQLQLLQPFFGLVLAAIFLNESITWAMIGATSVVVVCVVGAKRFA